MYSTNEKEYNKSGPWITCLKSATVHFVSLLRTLSIANIIEQDTEHVTTSMYKQMWFVES